MQEKIYLGGTVKAAVYAAGMEQGVTVLLPDGEQKHFQAADSQLYKAYQRHIDFGIVVPFVLYNGSRVSIRQGDTLVIEGNEILCILNADQAKARLMDKPKEEGATEAPKVVEAVSSPAEE